MRKHLAAAALQGAGANFSPPGEPLFRSSAGKFDNADTAPFLSPPSADPLDHEYLSNIATTTREAPCLSGHATLLLRRQIDFSFTSLEGEFAFFLAPRAAG